MDDLKRQFDELFELFNELNKYRINTLKSGNEIGALLADAMRRIIHEQMKDVNDQMKGAI